MSTIEHRFGRYGGQYVPETLMPALAELEQAWVAARADPGYRSELDGLLRDFAGRPTPLYCAGRLSERLGRLVYLKREDLNHTGSHKLNNALGQALLARRMGKRRIIAETGAGQHGVATATVCALLDLECEIYMGAEDTRRQRPNVQRMELLGATVHEVDAGARTLKEATSAAIRDWVTNVADTHYVIGSVVGPAPYPALVRDLQRVIGDEARAQLLEREGRLPTRVIACVGGGSNALGVFTAFLDDAHVQLIGVEAGGRGSTLRATAPRSPWVAARGCCTARSRRCCRTRRARSSRRTRSPRASTTPAPARSTRTCATAAARATWPSPTATRSPPSESSPARRASSPLWRPRTRSRGRSHSPMGTSTSCASPGAGTRTWPRFLRGHERG